MPPRSSDAGEPADLLGPLENVEERTATLWQKLFRGDALWRELHRGVTEKTLPDAVADWIADCLEQDADCLEQDEIAGLPGARANAKLGALLAKAAIEAAGLGFPSGASPDPAYRDCVRSFDNSLRLGETIRVPVAAASSKPGASPRLLWLELEVVSGGNGIVRHPRDMICLSALGEWGKPRPILEGSLRRAFSAARRLAGAEARACQGRWRLLDRDGNPVIDVDGPSASGAAFFGWYRGLTKTPYDPRVIVIAAMAETEPPQLESVANASIGQKVEAILAAACGIDTIGLLRENADAARGALEVHRRQDIRVVELQLRLAEG